MNDLAPLGFAIPAYRRPAHLDIALQSIVPQAAPLGAPLYIPDDSCDHTNVAVISKWKNVYGNIVHEINATNLGIDGNIDRAIIGCPSRYVHVLGDDDVILPGFAAQALDIISQRAPGHIVCSYQYLRNDYQPISGAAVIPRHAAIGSMRELLPTYGWALGFIGAHVFCRARFAGCETNGFGTYFHHLVRLIQYLDPQEPIGFVREPLVGNRADDESTATWSGDRLNVVFGIEKAFRLAMRERYSEAEIEDTVLAARRCLGYAEFFRLLYWGALAQRSGSATEYWGTLQQLVPRAQYERLRSVPPILYGPLREIIPWVRRTKRLVRRVGSWRG